MSTDLETFGALVRRFALDGDEPAVSRVSLAAALRDGSDETLRYIASLGIPIAGLDDLLAINGDPSEEELHAFRVAEGVAISIGSDGTWLLVEP
jgi:hypothetical protein